MALLLERGSSVRLFGIPRTQVREIRRRLHRDGEKRELGQAGAGIGDALLRRTAATDNHLLALGADPSTVHMATRSRKGYPTSLKLRRAGWRMSQNEIVRFALNNRWLEEQGVPDMNAIWRVLHFGPLARV